MSKDIFRIHSFFNSYMYIIFFFLGCFFAGNQLLVHYVGRSFDTNDIQFGYIIAAMYIGSLSMVLILGEVSEIIGKRLGVVIATLCYSVGALFIALAGNLNFTILAFFLYGCGVGGIEGVLFSLIGDYNGEDTHKVMNLSQASFSVGAVLGPLLINALVTIFNFRFVYTIMWALMAALAILFFLSRDIEKFARKTDNHPGGLMMFRLIRNPAMVLFMVVLMLAIGCETSVTYWLVNYFDGLGAIALGSIGLSIYWMSSIPGRFMGAWAKNQGRYLAYSFVAASGGILLLLFLPTPILKLIGILVLGLALAPVYPCISTLGARMFPDRSASAFSLMVFSCGIGGALSQPVIGAVSETSSITTVYMFITVLMILMAAMILWAVRLSKKHSNNSSVTVTAP